MDNLAGGLGVMGFLSIFCSLMAVLMDRKASRKYDSEPFADFSAGHGYVGAIFPYVGWRNWLKGGFILVLTAGLAFLASLA